MWEIYKNGYELDKKMSLNKFWRISIIYTDL